MSLSQRPTCLATAVTAALAACGDPPPLGPSETQRLTGTYTFTVAMSASCISRAGPWTFRADIRQAGRDFDVTLYEGDFTLHEGGLINSFRGKDHPDGVLYFSQGGASSEILFMDNKAGVWRNGQARGQFTDSRIDAMFSGDGFHCTAPDHPWTFVRR